MSLSERLRAATAEAHRAAENTSVVKQVLAGTLALGEYCRMMVNLHAIYQMLELQLELAAANSSIRHIADARLARTATIERDLTRLMGERWCDTFTLEAATHDYLKRLDSIGKAEPARLVAHAYVRYLGDLSGGQIISRAVVPMLGAAADEALHFYDFGSKSQVAELKASFRDGLGRIEAEADAIIDEALLAFEMSRSLFDQLGAKVDRPIVSI